MTTSQITARLAETFGEKILLALPVDKHPRVHIAAADLRAIAEFLYAEPSIKLNWLQNLSGVDYAADDQLCVVYHLWSFEFRHGISIKAYCSREDPHVPSVVDLWPAADWHEREAFDMFGLIFDGHPDLRRLLCADDWEGFPLRKDYIFPREYHGIPGSVELDWQQQPDTPK